MLNLTITEMKNLLLCLAGKLKMKLLKNEINLMFFFT